MSWKNGNVPSMPSMLDTKLLVGSAFRPFAITVVSVCGLIMMHGWRNLMLRRHTRPISMRSSSCASANRPRVHHERLDRPNTAGFSD